MKTTPYEVVLSDFGLSEMRETCTQEYDSYLDAGYVKTHWKGTIEYASPEIMNAYPEKMRFTIRDDIFSMGVTIGEIITKQPPYKNKNPQFFRMKKSHKIDPSSPAVFQVLYEWCTAPDRTSRPRSCAVVLQFMDQLTRLKRLRWYRNNLKLV